MHLRRKQASSTRVQTLSHPNYFLPYLPISLKPRVKSLEKLSKGRNLDDNGSTPRVFFKKEGYFVLDKLKRWNNNIRNFLAANLGSILFDIWAFQCILESLVMQTGGSLRRCLRKNEVAGKGSTCQ